MRIRVSMRWWLALAFAAVAALTAVAVADVFVQRAETSFRARAEELAAGSAVGAAEAVRRAFGDGDVPAVTAEQAARRRIALFVFDSSRRLLSADSSRGIAVAAVPAEKQALDSALGGGRYVRTFDRGRRILVGLPLRGGRAGALIAYASRPELAAELGIVRTEIVPSALIAVAVGGAVGILVALLLATRLRRIGRAAREIAAGKFETSLDPGFADELGDLAHTVDRMRVALRDSFEALDAERSRLQLLLERLHDGVVAVDRDLVVTFANEAARSMLGQKALRAGIPLPEPWAGTSLRELARGLFEPAAAAAERRVAADDEHAYAIVGLPPPAGVPAAVIVLTDVTERERRERAEREFVANAAHELRTPLAAIAAAVEALEAGAKDEPAPRDRFLAIVGRQSARLGRLVRALLVLARAQTRQEGVRLEPVDVRSLLEDVAPRGDGHDHGIDVECEPGLTVLGHRDLLEQVVSNLVGNALRYGNGGRVAVVARPRPGGRVEIEVSDTGPGIDAVDRERVFDRFYGRGGESGESFGLGLSIVREAVGALGGAVELESEQGAGTTVRVLLGSPDRARVAAPEAAPA